MSPMDASPVTVTGNGSFISSNACNKYWVISFLNILDSTTDNYLWYEHKIQSEIIRQTKNSKVLGLAVCPITEKQCGMYITE